MTIAFHSHTRWANRSIPSSALFSSNFLIAFPNVFCYNLHRLLCLLVVIMKLIFLMLLLFFILPIPALAEEVKIAVLTDPHYIAPELTDHGPYFSALIASGDGKIVGYCDEILDAFIAEMLASPVDCLILSGDLTFNGALQSHIAFRDKLQVLRDAGIPVYVIPGNHDVYNLNAAHFEGAGFARVFSATSANFADIWQDFGLSDAIARDSASLSYTVDCKDLRFLMLDVNTEGNIGVLTDATLAWAREQLIEAKKDNKRIIGISHQNLLVHNPLFISGFRIENAGKLLPLYEEYGVLFNVSGHMHTAHIAGTEGTCPEIVVSSAVVSPCQYGLFTIGESGLDYETKIIDVSGYAASIGSENADLLSFRQYAAAFFVLCSLSKSSRTFENADPETRDAVITYMANLNAAYFSGNLTKFSPQDEYYKMLLTPDFQSVYMKSIESDLGKDYTHLHYDFGGNQR